MGVDIREMAPDLAALAQRHRRMPVRPDGPAHRPLAPRPRQIPVQPNVPAPPPVVQQPREVPAQPDVPAPTAVVPQPREAPIRHNAPAPPPAIRHRGPIPVRAVRVCPSCEDDINFTRIDTHARRNMQRGWTHCGGPNCTRQLRYLKHCRECGRIRCGRCRRHR